MKKRNEVNIKIDNKLGQVSKTSKEFYQKNLKRGESKMTNNQKMKKKINILIIHID